MIWDGGDGVEVIKMIQEVNVLVGFHLRFSPTHIEWFQASIRRGLSVR